jgi:hypothetical protein
MVVKHWSLKKVLYRLLVSERKTPRKIFGPTKKNNGNWRIKTNKELDELIKHRNIINCVKAQILSWVVHINRMTVSSIVKKIYKWKPFRRRPVGRPKAIVEKVKTLPEL